MGMDIDGKNPFAPEGEYFRAGAFSWPAILDLSKAAIEKHELEIDTTGWEFNDGEGCKDSEKCIALANAIEQDLGLVDDATRIQAKSRSAAGDALMSIFGGKASYDTDAEHVREWCRFLRTCGGFEIH